jgi:hypothetical protein
VVCLGWLLCLTLTGRSPYALELAPDLPLLAVREGLRPLVLTGRFRALELPAALQAVEALARRALAPTPLARLPSSAAFAEALQALAPGLGLQRRAASGVTLPALPAQVSDELLPLDLEASLAREPDDAPAWLDLARRLEEAHGGYSSRAALIRAQPEPATASPGGPGLVPALPGERLECTWRRGYVRVLVVHPASRPAAVEAEARTSAVSAVLAHPSLRFVRELRLAGPRSHARVWVEALQRQPPLALRQVTLDAVADTDPWALDLAYRLPRWTWSFGAGPRRPPLAGTLRRLLGRRKR